MKKVKGFLFLISMTLILAVLFSACGSKLKAPSNLQTDGTTLKWNAVENASYYIVRVDAEEYKTVTNSYSLWAYRDLKCQIKVKAIKDSEGKFFESNWSYIYYWKGA